jgi:hypothetical protein
MTTVVGIIVGVVLGVPLGILLGGFLLSISAALCNVEELRFSRACGIVLLETVFVAPITAGGIFLMGVLGYPLTEIKDFSVEQFLVACGLLGVLLAVVLVVSVIVFRLLLHVGVRQAARIWALRFLIQLLLTGLVGGFVLVGLAVTQIASLR